MWLLNIIFFKWNECSFHSQIFHDNKKKSFDTKSHIHIFFLCPEMLVILFWIVYKCWNNSKSITLYLLSTKSELSFISNYIIWSQPSHLVEFNQIFNICLSWVDLQFFRFWLVNNVQILCATMRFLKIFGSKHFQVPRSKLLMDHICLISPKCLP